MAAGSKTITDVYTVLQKHLSLAQRGKLLADLTQVKGNRSFTTTVRLLAQLHQRLSDSLTTPVWGASVDAPRCITPSCDDPTAKTPARGDLSR